MIKILTKEFKSQNFEKEILKSKQI